MNVAVVRVKPCKDIEDLGILRESVNQGQRGIRVYVDISRVSEKRRAVENGGPSGKSCRERSSPIEACRAVGESSRPLRLLLLEPLLPVNLACGPSGRV